MSKFEKGESSYYTNFSKGSVERHHEKGMSRRDFLKIASLFGASMALGGYGTKKILFSQEKEEFEKYDFEELSEKFWAKIIEDVSRKDGEEITPMEIKADLIIKALRIPEGWVWGLSTEEKKSNNSSQAETIRTAPELDQLLAKYFSGTVKVFETKDGPIVSSDPRDFKEIGERLENFKKELEKISAGKAIGQEIYEIIKKEYTYLKEETGKWFKLREDASLEFVWLPGGVPLFLRDYLHDDKEWEGEFGEHLAETYKNAEYIAIETMADVPLGHSPSLFWNDKGSQKGRYDQLMKRLVAFGFEGSFLEVDARDCSKIIMDNYYDIEDGLFKAVNLPDEFYEKYFAYLQRENPLLSEKIGNSKNLKEFCLLQSTSDVGVIARSEKNIFQSDKKVSVANAYLDEKRETSTVPTGMELGQGFFADALSALKLHKLAQAMNEGKIKKGMIVDFQGNGHLPGKSFFIKNPRYAAMVVLSVVGELLAKYAGEDLSGGQIFLGQNNPDNLEKMYQIFEGHSPSDKHSMSEVIFEEIAKIPQFDIEKDPQKTVEIGPNQKKIFYNPSKSINGLEGLDPEILLILQNSDKYIQEEIDKWKRNRKK